MRALHSTDPKKRVVVTGMGVCSVFGNDPEVYYDKLLAGVSGARLGISRRSRPAARVSAACRIPFALRCCQVSL